MYFHEEYVDIFSSYIGSPTELQRYGLNSPDGCTILEMAKAKGKNQE
jgi:hypothetical protein